MRDFFHKYSTALAFALMACVLAFSLTRSDNTANEKLHRAQIRACEERNALREESNKRIASHVADRDGLESILTSAYVARRKAYLRDHHESDAHAAAVDLMALRDVQAKVKFDFIPPVDCVATEPKP